LRFASPALGSTETETTKTQKGKVTPMAHVKWILSIATEMAWTLGTSMLAGLPLLT